MKKTMLIIGVLAGVICFKASAQKLPNVQANSLRAPVGIKIDGKTTEWDNHFQAYNRATDVFYTISNDDNNLYLTVQAKDQSIINKIMSGGVTFTISTTGKKNDKDGISIIYPVFDRKNRPFFGGSKLAFEKRMVETTDNSDSVTMAHNKLLGEKSKLIGVTGIPGVDSLISVYNTDGIKVAELFDTKGGYTYELAVSLKKLGLSAANQTKFAYHITLTGNAPAGQAVSISNGDNAILETKIFVNGLQSAPTDFWGEYALAK